MSAHEPAIGSALTALDRLEPVYAPPVRTAASSAEEERRRRRMISNRESARRSRLRKQRQLEGLRLEANRLGSQNRGLADRLGALSYYAALFRRENARLRDESAALRQRLGDIRRAALWWRLVRMPQMPSADSADVGGRYVAGNDPILASLMV
ncbi:unnamed protein product [Musa acuminata var. zebrina]